MVQRIANNYHPISEFNLTLTALIIKEAVTEFNSEIIMMRQTPSFGLYVYFSLAFASLHSHRAGLFLREAKFSFLLITNRYIRLEITHSVQPRAKHTEKREVREETLLAAISREYLK